MMYGEAKKPPPRFDNKNGLLQDPLQLYKESAMVNVWTETEKDIFCKKYLEKPKKFQFIASFLKRKSVADCVAFYYCNKKKEKYKEKCRELRQSKYKKNRGKKV